MRKALSSRILNLPKLAEHYEYFFPIIGLVPLGYVFYSGYIDLPPYLNNIVVFLALFIGLSIVLYWRQKFFILPLLIGYIGLFFLPLTWLWRGLEFDDNVLMGIFPFNDGMFYLMDAYRLLMGLERMISPNVRPIYSGVLSFLMWLFDGNLQIALAMFVLAISISIFFLALEIREFAGPITTGLATSMLFYFMLPFLGRVHTENLGIALGSLGLALLLRSARKGSLPALLAGAFSLSLALNTRAGAFTVLPALLLWTWINRKVYGWKSLVLLLGSISLGFLINAYIIKTFGAKGQVAFSNYGMSLYGLAAGYKGYGYILTVHPEVTYQTNAFPYAFNLILKNPFMLLYGMLLSLKDYFSPNIMFYLIRFHGQQNMMSWVLYLLTLAGGYRLIKERRNTIQGSLILFLLAGVLLSVAVIPTNDGGARALMSTNPINALVAGLAFSSSMTREKRKYFNITLPLPEIYTAFLGLICALGPFIVFKYPPKIPPIPVLSCPDGTEQISVFVNSGSYINIVRDGPIYGFLPEVRKDDIKRRLDDYYSFGDVPYDALTNFQEFENLIRKRLRPGDTILIGPNLLERNIGDGPYEYIFLIVRTDHVEVENINHFCARLAETDRLQSNRFYYDMSVDVPDN